MLGGFSCAEIAALLRVGEQAAMQRLSRARQAMRRLWLGEAAPGSLALVAESDALVQGAETDLLRTVRWRGGGI